MVSLVIKRIIPKKIPVVISSFVTKGTFSIVANSHLSRNQATIWSVLWQQYKSQSMLPSAYLNDAVIGQSALQFKEFYNSTLRRARQKDTKDPASC